MSIQPTDSSYLTSVSYVATDKTSEAAKKTEKTTTTTSVKAPASEETELTLTSLSDDLDAASDVDWNKVNDVKNALANGDLNVDLDTLSQAILDMHRS